MKYVLIKRYEIDIPDTTTALELKAHYEDEAGLVSRGLSIREVVENMVEDFHVGNCTDMVKHTDTTFYVIQPLGVSKYTPAEAILQQPETD